MSHMNDPEDPQRRQLIRMLSMGIIVAGAPGGHAMAAGLFGSRPGKLPPGQSIYRLSGEATVNGKRATAETRIFPGDTITTARDSELIFVLDGGHAMILRDNSHLVLETTKNLGSTLLGGLRLLTGKLLSVSRNSKIKVNTATASIGVRGTGFYVESAPDLTYFCTCYGVTDVVASADPESKTTVESKHHDRPLYITKDGARGKNIRNAPFINHTDQELALIEALVGRTTPFIFDNDAYSAPRREY